MRGNISQKVKSDETAFKFWDAVEKSLGSLLGPQTTGTGQDGSGQGFTVNRLTGTIYADCFKKEP